MAIWRNTFKWECDSILGFLLVLHRKQDSQCLSGWCFKIRWYVKQGFYENSYYATPLSLSDAARASLGHNPDTES